MNPGKGLAQLWTVREFPHDFHLKLQFRAGVNADSGIFLRKPQLQCRDYLVAGPYKELKNYKPQDWNEIEVIVKGDIGHLHLQRRTAASSTARAAANRADRSRSRPRADGISPHSDQGRALAGEGRAPDRISTCLSGVALGSLAGGAPCSLTGHGGACEAEKAGPRLPFGG